MDFEKNLKRLEEIVKKLEDGELRLEESLTLFEEGIKISRLCNEKLSEAEKKVKALLATDGEGKAVLKDFVDEK